MPTSTLSDRLLAALKNNCFVAVIVVASTIILAVAQITGALDKILPWFGLDGRAPAIYRPLVADLGNLEEAIHRLAAINLNSSSDRNFQDLILIQIHFVEVAAKPVCNAKESISELGDDSTRKELDSICLTVALIKPSGQATAGVGAVLLAKSIEDVGAVRQLREKLLPRTESAWGRLLKSAWRPTR